jgi:hypothetical protein
MRCSECLLLLLLFLLLLVLLLLLLLLLVASTLALPVCNGLRRLPNHSAGGLSEVTGTQA